MSFVSELIVADEEVVVVAGVLSEQPTTVTRAQTASKARTRFFIVSLQIAETKPTGQWGKITHDERRNPAHLPTNVPDLPGKRGLPPKTTRKTPESDEKAGLTSSDLVPL